MAQSFKVGDVVRLNSGGPKMTLTHVQSDGAVRCAWFSPDRKLENAVFPPDGLHPAKAKK